MIVYLEIFYTSFVAYDQLTKHGLNSVVSLVDRIAWNSHFIEFLCSHAPVLGHNNLPFIINKIQLK